MKDEVERLKKEVRSGTKASHVQRRTIGEGGWEKAEEGGSVRTQGFSLQRSSLRSRVQRPKYLEEATGFPLQIWPIAHRTSRTGVLSS